jgi:hypothetical protein
VKTIKLLGTNTEVNLHDLRLGSGFLDKYCAHKKKIGKLVCKKFCALKHHQEKDSL